MNADTLLKLIESHYSRFTKTQKKIADYIYENHMSLPSTSVQELATILNTSDATIIRFAQSLGFKGYLDMRACLKTELNEYYAPQSRFNRIAESNTDTPFEQSQNSIVEIVAKNDMECHKDFYESFDRRQIYEVADEINKAETIHITGFGTDSFPATFLDWYLDIMGYKTECYTDGGFATSKRISRLCEKDLLISFITPRFLKIEKSILCTANDVKAHTICISTANSIELNMLCDNVLSISERSNEWLNSYVTCMSLCNMIIMAVYESNQEVISDNLKKNEAYEKFFDIFL